MGILRVDKPRAAARLKVRCSLPVTVNKIVVEYRPAFFPWKREKIFRFKTYRQTNGNLYWYSAPLR